MPQELRSWWTQRALAIAIVPLSLVPGCSKIQERALQKQAFAMCAEQAGEGRTARECEAIVEARLPHCAPPFLKQQTDAETYFACLGLASSPAGVPSAAVPEPAECAPPKLRLHASAFAALKDPWGGKKRVVAGQELYVSPDPIFDERDIVLARLDETGQTIYVELAPEGARRLELLTAVHRGGFIVMRVNGTEVAAELISPIKGGKLILARPRGSAPLLPKDVCEP